MALMRARLAQQRHYALRCMPRVMKAFTPPQAFTRYAKAMHAIIL